MGEGKAKGLGTKERQGLMAACCERVAPLPAKDVEASGKGEGWRAYAPLGWFVGVSFLAALALSVAGVGWMAAWMGVFLILLGIIKVIDIEGYARTARAYDWLTRRVPGYGKVYPFLELGLGLWLLSGQGLAAAGLAVAVVFGYATLSVLVALRGGVMMQCACLGSVLRVPLSWVTVAEYGIMAGMGAMMALGI
jgi:hypothetical protein